VIRFHVYRTQNFGKTFEALGEGDSEMFYSSPVHIQTHGGHPQRTLSFLHCLKRSWTQHHPQDITLSLLGKELCGNLTPLPLDMVLFSCWDTNKQDLNLNTDNACSILKDILTNIPIPGLLLGKDGTCLCGNPTLYKEFGIPKDVHLPTKLFKIYSASPQSYERLQKEISEASPYRSHIFYWKTSNMLPGGHTELGLHLHAPFQDQDFVIALISDTLISPEKQRLQLYEQIFNSAMEGIAIFRHDGLIQAANPAFCDLVGLPREHVLGLPIHSFCSNKHHAQDYAKIIHALRRKSTWFGELQGAHSCGEEFPLQLSVSKLPLKLEHHQIYLALLHDVTSIKQKEHKIEEQAFYDALTGLPNRRYLTETLSSTIQCAQKKGQELALFFMDLDNFKTINDSLGHPTGDRLLQNVAQRMKERLPITTHVFRQGGDEFIVLVENGTGKDDARKISHQILKSFEAPFEIEERRLYITPSIGISFFPHDAHNSAELIRNADLAMYHAKSCGKNTYRFYSRKLNTRAQKRLEIENALRSANVEKDFYVLYQPIHDAKTQRISGVEALIRWNQEGSVPIGPDQFIPVAEETGIIFALSEFVLRTACRETQYLLKEGLGPLRVAVNLSAQQLYQKDFADRVQRMLRETGLPPAALELELTESTLIPNIRQTARVLQQLNKEGIRIAIDDFGTGYSSLNYLHRLPIQTLKIDKSFIQDAPDSKLAGNLVATMSMLAQNLGKRIVAEGVENLEQFEFALEKHCDEIQGFYFNSPVNHETLYKLLKEDRIQHGAMSQLPPAPTC